MSGRALMFALMALQSCAFIIVFALNWGASWGSVIPVMVGSYFAVMAGHYQTKFNDRYSGR